jgi:hypothetical protein
MANQSPKAQDLLHIAREALLDIKFRRQSRVRFNNALRTTRSTFARLAKGGSASPKMMANQSPKAHSRNLAAARVRRHRPSKAFGADPPSVCATLPKRLADAAAHFSTIC